MVTVEQGEKRSKSRLPVLHEIELQRGWRLRREKVQVEVDLENRVVFGVATITFIALHKEFSQVRLNSRRCEILACSVNSINTTFEIKSPLDDRILLNSVSSETMRYRLDDMETEIDKRTEEAEDGELFIVVPESVRTRFLRDLWGTSKTEQPKRSLDTYPKFTVRVEYRTLDPSAGAVFCRERESNRAPAEDLYSYMITDGRHGLARCWMPCVDSPLWCDKCSWELEVLVQEHLMTVASGDLVTTRLVDRRNKIINGDIRAIGMDGIEYKEGFRINGEISRTKSDDVVDEKYSVHKQDPLMKLFLFRLEVAAHASEIAMAVGPFRPLADPQCPRTVTHFCLPGSAKRLVHTSPPLYAKFILFYKDYFGAEPPIHSFKQLFVDAGDCAEESQCAAGGLAIYPGSILHTPRDIDEAYDARILFARTICQCYLGRMIRPRTQEDMWLINGLVSHISSLALRSVLGNNWYRYSVFDLVQEVINETPATAARLSSLRLGRPADSVSASAVRRAHIIVHMVSTRVGADVLRRALRDLIAEAREASSSSATPASALGFDDATRGLGVAFFLKRLRSICNIDVRGLVRLWATSVTFPRVQFGYRYNPRRNLVEFVAKQPPFKPPGSVKHLASHSFSRNLDLNPPIPLTGTLTVRVSESDGTYDHCVEIRDAITVTELPCHSRRSKNKMAIKEAREAIKSKGGGEAYTPINYVIVDPELEHPCNATFLQPQRAWLALLKYERDAISQQTACEGLARLGTPEATKALSRTLADAQLYWRVRAAAANALTRCPEGLDALLEFFRSSFGDQSRPEEDQLLPNNFRDLSSYFVKRAVVSAIASFRTDKNASNTGDGDIHPKALSLLLRLLEDNDNLSNQFSDRHYLATVLRCTAEASSDERVIRQIWRYADLSVLNPDPVIFRAIVSSLFAVERPRIATVAALRDLSRLQLSPNEKVLKLLTTAASQGSHFKIKEAAFHAFIRLYGSDLVTVLWVLSKADRTQSGDDLLEFWRKSHLKASTAPFEPLRVRLAAIQAISGTTSCDPLRRHTKRAMEICVRLLRIGLLDPDPRVRAEACDAVRKIWGTGVPICLLTERQYREECKQANEIGTPRESTGMGFSENQQRRLGFGGRRPKGSAVENSANGGHGLKHHSARGNSGSHRSHDDDKFIFSKLVEEESARNKVDKLQLNGSTFPFSSSNGKKTKSKNPLLTAKPVRIPVAIPKLVPKESPENLPDYDDEDYEYMVRVLNEGDYGDWDDASILNPGSPFFDAFNDTPAEKNESKKKKKKKKRKRGTDGLDEKKRKKKKKKRKDVKDDSDQRTSILDTSIPPSIPMISGVSIASASEGGSIRSVGSGGMKLKIKIPSRPASNA